jgi:hypothetical protein
VFEVREEAVQFESNSAGKAARVFGVGKIKTIRTRVRQVRLPYWPYGWATGVGRVGPRSRKRHGNAPSGSERSFADCHHEMESSHAEAMGKEHCPMMEHKMHHHPANSEKGPTPANP